MRILATAAEPMRVGNIHTAVSERLGEPVPYSSVKDALASHADGEIGDSGAPAAAATSCCNEPPRVGPIHRPPRKAVESAPD
jgi:hypothetical protein